MSQIDIAALIRNIPDFPQPGIQFKDITPLLNDGPAFRQVVNVFGERYQGHNLTAVAAIEARGFIFGAVLAYVLGIGLVPIRKPGKLPAATFTAEYDLEYGTNRLEVHQDALSSGSRVVVIDDLLATGGTMGATCGLLERMGATIEEIAFVIELEFLKGREQLHKYPVFSLIQY